jgi:hypothetical protein
LITGNERDRGADAGQGDDHLEEGAPEHAGAAARADDEVLVGLEVAVEDSVGIEMNVIR